MNKYKNLIGGLIKYHRERLDISQKELCYGICVVSHLSKIENNKVEPSDEIIDELFQRLGVNFYRDKEFIKDNKLKINNFFFNLNYYREVKYIFNEISDHRDKLVNSPLIIDYILAESYARTKIIENIKRLSELEIYMDSEQLGWFYILKALNSKNINEINIRELISRGTSLLRNSYSQLSLIYFELSIGQFDKVIELNSEAANIALSEGNIMALAHINVCMGNCYAAQGLSDLMLPHYTRAINILTDINKKDLISTINYNMGATYLENGKYEESLYYLEKANDEYLKGDDSIFLLYHKLSLLHLKLNNKQKTKNYIDKAKESLEFISGNYDTYELMIEVAELQLDKDYLENSVYLERLEKLCNILGKDYPRGFYLFHKRMLEELYCHLRQYKKAYLIK